MSIAKASDMHTWRPLKVALVLGLIAFSLVLASLAGQLTKYLTGHDYVFGLVELFSLNSEMNIPAFFSAGLLLFSALLLLIIVVQEKNRGGREVVKWAVLSAGFLLMAIDESMSFHERLIEPIRELLGAGRKGVFFYAWVIPGLALVLVLGLFFLRFLLRLPSRTRFIFLIGAALYLGGAIGVELFEGRYSEIHGQRNLAFNLIVMVEESLEMAGVIVFIYGLLRYLTDGHADARFSTTRFAQPRRASSPDSLTSVSDS